MAVNEKLVYEVFKAKEKSGLPQRHYSFLLKQFLGMYGEVKNHELIGKKIININTKREYEIKKVFLQWYKNGYFWNVSCVDSNNFWNSFVIGTANCEEKIILDSVLEFNFKYVIK